MNESLKSVSEHKYLFNVANIIANGKSTDLKSPSDTTKRKIVYEISSTLSGYG